MESYYEFDATPCFSERVHRMSAVYLVEERNGFFVYTLKYGSLLDHGENHEQPNYKSRDAKVELRLVA